MPQQAPLTEMGEKVKKKIYSWDLDGWVKSQLPQAIKDAMNRTGWNTFGIYEMVKEGLALERKGRLPTGVKEK